MSFWGRLFGTDKAIEQTIGTASKILDEAFYTKEEKADARADARRDAQSMVIDWMRNTQGQNLARRLIALSVTAIWLLMHLLSTGLAYSAVWAEVPAQLIASASVIDYRLESLTPAVMLILGFYFAAPFLGDIAEGAIQRFGKKQ